MTTVTHSGNDNASNPVLYMALELSSKKWLLVFGNGKKIRQISIDANNIQKLDEEIKRSKEKFKLLREATVYSCYEAGRDGFWIHRHLEEIGIINYVIDSSSVSVTKKARQSKTDRIDGEKLLRKLISHVKGEEKLQIARVPSLAQEDARRTHRERERLKREKTSHINRIKSLLNLHGIKCSTPGRKGWGYFIEKVCDWKGESLAENLKEELSREIERLDLIQKQLKLLHEKMTDDLSQDTEQAKMIKDLIRLKGVGGVSAWVLIMEWLSWRKFKNRREIGAAAGLVGTPHDSGNSRQELGITKAGNRRIRALMVELSWGWLRHQANSDLSKWFYERFNQSKRFRKVGIVALARKLLIAIWRYTTTGEVPKGAELKDAVFYFR
jgi:transposase